MHDQLPVESEKLIAQTERGELWRGTQLRRDADSRKGDRILRFITPIFNTTTFREKALGLREKQYSCALPVVAAGWRGGGYYLEYRADAPWETLEDHFNRLHWRQRLVVMQKVCEALAQWQGCPMRPLGLNGRNIVMVESAVGYWSPWLLPAPPLKYESPHDLWGCDALILSSLAPEIVRGLQPAGLAQDIYALGHLTLLALGCRPASQADPAEQLEAQACGALMKVDLADSDVEAELRSKPAFKELLQIVRHHLQPRADARPNDAADLLTAYVKVLSVTDPLVLALGEVRRQNWRKALAWLDWGREHFGDDHENRVLAADVCERMTDDEQAVEHLEAALYLMPAEERLVVDKYRNLLVRCCKLRRRLWEKSPPAADGAADEQGDLLLEKLAMLKQINFSYELLKLAEGDAQESYLPLKERNLPYFTAADVYRRRGDWEAARAELEEAIGIEWTNWEALLRYGQLYQELGQQPEAEQTAQLALYRIAQALNGYAMTESEAQKWRTQFNKLLAP